MEDRRNIRASDRDREAVVEQLRAALDEGRLNLFEYDERLARAYQSQTYGELSDLFADLPAGTVTKWEPRPVSAAAAPAPAHPLVVQPGIVSDLPTWIKLLWTIWITAVLANLIVWGILSSHGSPKVFWPGFVAGPGLVVLLGLSAGATVIRRNRRREALRKSLKAARRRANPKR